MSTHHLTCGSITYWAGGYDQAATGAAQRIGRVTGSWDRLDRLGEVIEQGITGDEPGPRILFWQHGNHFDLDGDKLLHRVERLLAPYGRYRGYVTRSDWNVTHDVVFLREAVGDEPPLWVDNHWHNYDDDDDRAQVGWVQAQVGDDGPVLLLRSVLLYPWLAARRVEQSEHIIGSARSIRSKIPGGATVLIGGSFNSADSHPDNPKRDWALAARLDPEGVKHKGRLKDDGSGEYEADTTTMDCYLGRWSPAARRRLGATGWVSLSQLDGNWEPTVEHNVDKGGPLKINDFLSTRDILVPGSSRTHHALAAGKHRYITVTVAV